MKIENCKLKIGIVIAVLQFAICNLQFAMADATWTLTTADFKSQPADLKSVDKDALHLSINNQNQSLPLSQFLSIERTALPPSHPAKFLLHLTTADTIAGSPTSLANEQLAWKSPLLGDLVIPIRQIQSITRPDVKITEEKHTQDVVTMINGDTLRGIIAEISADKISLQSDTDTTPIPLDSVAAIALATQSPTTQPSELNTALRVSLTDGSVITAAALTSGEKSWTITLADKSTRSIDLAAISSIEQINGPVSWLPARTPTEIAQIPYFGSTWPTRFDRSVTNQPLTFGGKIFHHGIGVHSFSRITYPLDGTYSTFRTQYAIDGDEPYADVTVRILLDGKVAHEQKNVHAGQLSPVVQIPLASAKSLTLEVDYGNNRDTQDRLNWIEPALVK